MTFHIECSGSGTSTHTGFNLFPLDTINGGMHKPAALTITTTVIFQLGKKNPRALQKASMRYQSRDVTRFINATGEQRQPQVSLEERLHPLGARPLDLFSGHVTAIALV